VGTVALLVDGAVAADGAVAMRGADEERLLPLVADVLARGGHVPTDLARVVCGNGPGSFTSLRIAAAIGKGIAIGAGVALHAVSSLALCAASTDVALGPGRYVAALDALRDEHYVATCTVADGGQVVEVGDVARWPTPELRDRAAGIGPLVGPGLTIDATPHARKAIRLASMLARTPPVNVGGWEPDYGRLAEAQIKWEAAHGRPLSAT